MTGIQAMPGSDSDVPTFLKTQFADAASPLQRPSDTRECVVLDRLAEVEEEVCAKSGLRLGWTRKHGLPTELATTTVVAVEIRPSARKHGISDDDIRHAIDNAIAAITRPEQPGFTMLIGPDAAACLLEVGVIETDDQDYVIHAMAARNKYLSMLDTPGGDQS